MRRPLVDEMDVQPVDFSEVVIEPVQRGFPRSPVVTVSPIGGQIAGVGQRYALAPVVDGLGVRPPGAGQTLLQVVENGIGDVDTVRPDFGHGSYHAGTADRRVSPGPRRYHRRGVTKCAEVTCP